MASASEIRLGVIGCGGFGLFALQQFVQTPGIRLVGMAGTHRPAAQTAAKRFGIPDIVEPEQLVADPNLDVVYIASPPFLHYPQTMLALRAGKHVICEKPLALRSSEADEMIAEARARDRLLVANLMQRYNPMFEKVRQLIDSKVLGEVLHGYFENYASDENLPPEHWFWDREKSGGIFIEHGVHFFDLFTGWLGQGKVVAAQSCKRPGTNIEDQVHCTVLYDNTILVNFYHGFQHPGRLDRQEIRLVFERGDVTLFEWVPTTMRIRAIVSEEDTRKLHEICPDCIVDVLDLYGPNERGCVGHGNAYDVYQKIELRWREGCQKLALYCQLLRGVMNDQAAWIRDHTHRRIMTEDNGRQSLQIAETADQIARQV